MEIIIDKINFWSLEAMKYWQHPKSTPIETKREESRYMCLSGDYYGAVKKDGFFAMLIKDANGDFHLRSRTESVNGGFADKAEWIPWITEELSSLPNETVLLGEIYFPNNEGSRKITSVLNCLKDKCIERQKSGEPLHFYVFDVLAYCGKSLINTAFETRIDHYLNYELLDVLTNNTYITMAEYKSGQELWDLYGSVIAAGGEGIVITRKDCKYMPGKRTARMTLKMKKEINQTIDAFLTGNYKPATRAYSGDYIEEWPYWQNVKTLEKVNTCKFNSFIGGESWEPITKAYYYGWASSVEIGVLDGEKVVPIGYISGITDELKAGIVSEPDKYFHKVYEITAMEIEHINGGHSLRHAKFVQERKDKNWTDCEFSQIV